MFDGANRTVDDVRHVSNLKKNLISFSILDSKKYEYTCAGGVLKVNKVICVMLNGQKKGPN